MKKRPWPRQLPDRFAKRRRDTRLMWGGREPDITGPFINPPVVHASTVLFPDTATLSADDQHYTYARRGNPTSEALELAVSELHGAYGTVVCPSGLSACTTALMAFLASGDELLMVDSAYYPTHHAARTVLDRFGVTTRFYAPDVGARIADLFTGETKAIFLESPGSGTFEMQDIPAIADAAKARGITLICDNTWASPLHCQPLALGADVVVEAATKYLVGHSDASVGTVSTTEAAWQPLHETHGTLGLHLAPDDAFLTLRGLRTLAVRLRRHEETALVIAKWLASRPEVARVLYPPLPGAAGHDLWQRDMTGGSGLFGVVFDGWDRKRVEAVADRLELFGKGWSWGGYESLVSVTDPRYRRAAPWTGGPILRLYAGLEDPRDLIDDLAQALGATT